MKKLFISCPMRARTEKDIRKSMQYMHGVAERIFGEELEAIDSYIQTTPNVRDTSLWCLGTSIQMMADADYFIGITDMDTVVNQYHGCYIESLTASRYKIRSAHLPLSEVLLASDR